jgi:hypothetical protein
MNTPIPVYKKRLANGLELTDAMKLEQQRDELLAACKRLLERSRMLDQSATNEGLTNCEVIANARAAIAKAEGRSE